VVAFSQPLAAGDVFDARLWRVTAAVGELRRQKVAGKARKVATGIRSSPLLPLHFVLRAELSLRASKPRQPKGMYGV
jgi:hypothetical protein